MKRRILLLIVLCAPAPLYAEDAVVVRGDRLPESDQDDSTALLDRLYLDEDPRIQHGWGDLLDRSLGARIQRSGSPGRREVLQLRGAGAHQTTVYLDGVRLSGERGGSFDLSSIATPCIQSVDVLRGSVGAAYGSGAQGGVVRLNPRKASQSLRLGSTLGAFGYLEGHACAGVGDDTTYLNLSVQHDQADGRFDYIDVNGRSRIRENNDHRRDALLVNGSTTDERLGRLGIVLSGHRTHRGEPGSSQFPTDMANSSDRRLAAGISWQVNPQPGEAFPTFMGVQWTHRAYEFSDPDPSFAEGSGRFNLSDQNVSAEAKVKWTRSAWILPSFVLQGGMHTAKTVSTTGVIREEHRSTGAVVNQLDVFPLNTVTVNLINRTDMRNGRPPVWLPKTGVVWRPTVAWSYGFSVGRHFRDPSFDELFFQGSGISGNPDLRPEMGWSADSHLAYHPRTGPWSVHLAGYRQKFQRIILFMPLDAYRIQASDELSADMYGLEARMRFLRKPFFVESNYHFQVHQDGQNRPLPFRPPHRLNLRLGWSAYDVKLYGGMVAQSEVYSDAYGRRKLPNYALFDTGILFTLPAGFEAGLDVRNLLDQAQVFDSIHQPLPGRSFYGALRWTDTTR